MKKKNIVYGIAFLSAFILTSCNGSPTFTKDRGQEDNTLPNVEIPDVLRHTDVSYTVKHELENENGGYDVVYVQNLSGQEGELTVAQALEYKGFTPLEFEQKILNEQNITIEIKYKAKEYKLTLAEIDKNIGYVYGGGDYYAYNNEATLTAKPNIGYEFIGWYNGENELSKEKTYSFSIEENMDVYGKFKISDEFKIFDFTSDQSLCTINGLVGDAPKDLIIPENVTKINERAFYQANLTNVVLPTTLKEIGESAFEYSSIFSLTINSDVKLDRYAFYRCSMLYEIFNNSNLDLQIGSTANAYVALYALIIHTSADEASIFTKQDDYLYAVVEDKLSLVKYEGNEKKLELPESVTIADKTYDSYSIGKLALANNEDLVIVTIPEAVTSIENGAFVNCTNLYEIYNLSELNITAGDSTNGNIAAKALYVHDSKDDKQLVFYNEDCIYSIDEDDLTIIKYVNETEKNVVISPYEDYNIIIGKEAFYGNTTIESVKLCDKVVAINDSAFQRCSNLKRVEANSVQSIGTYAFAYCYDLTEFSMNSCQSIGIYAFTYCYSLYQIKIPNTMTSFGNYAFINCYKLVYVLNESTCSISTGSSSYGYVGYYAKQIASTESDFFTNTNGFITYNYYDSKYLVKYVGEEENVIVPNDIDEIDQGAFYKNIQLKSITIPSTTTVNSSILFKCENVEYVDFPYSLNRFADLFIQYSSSSSNVNIPSTLKKVRLSGDIGYISSSYFDSVNLESLDIAGTVSEFNSLFGNINTLKDIYFEGTIVNWLSLSFYNAQDNPMYYASNLYFLDEEGDITFGNNKFSLVKEITLPEDLTSIGAYQFYGFPIEKLTIPSTVTSVGDSAFAKCKNLTDVSLNGLNEIGYAMFTKCSSLKNIDLTGVTSMMDEAFSGCESLVRVTLPTTITAISDNAFKNCYSLQKVTMLGDVTSIGSNAFANCYVLNSIELPNTVSTIGSGAFRNCDLLKTVSLKDTQVTEIASYLFAGCRSLTTLEFGLDIENVGEHAFDNCKIALNKIDGAYYLGTETNLYKWLVKVDKTETTVTVNENCEIILESAFAKCKSLKSLTIPNTISTIGQILKGNSTLEYLSVPFIGDGSEHQNLNYLFGYNSVDYNYAPLSLKTVAITGNGTSIPASAFKNARCVTTVIFPDNVTSIGENAFYNSGITNINLKNVATIGSSAFASSGLKSITMTDKLTSIGNNAFESCSYLETVNMSNISNSCTIGTYLFSNCSQLSNVVLGNCKNISNRMFNNCTALEGITIPNTINSIGQYAFTNSGLTEIDLSQMQSTATIGDHAFASCANLTTAVLPEITTIDSYLFYDCAKLETCEIPSSVTIIKDNAFNNTRLRSVTIPADISTAIGSLAFGNNPMLETVTINCTSSSYASTNYGIFSGCNKIKTVVFGEGCTTAYSKLFSGRSSISSVTFPSTLTSIGSQTFYNCTSLTSVTIPANVTSIDSQAFDGCTKLLEVYNLSGLTVTAGSENNGHVAYYAIEVHADLNDDSIYEKDSNGFTFIVKGGKGYLFAYDGDETNITLPSSFTKKGVTYDTYDIYSNALMNNTNITDVTIPGSVKVIGKSAFEGCENLKNVTLEEGVTTIEDSAFYNCGALENLSLPNSLEAIYGSSSYGNYSKMNYYLSSSGDKYLGNENNHYLVFVSYRSSYINTLDIEEGCKIIAPYSANCIYSSYNCTITLPEGLIFIGDSAFADCTGIKNKSITFPSTLKYIGKNAFNNTGGLVDVSLANTQVEYIGSYAFWSDATTNKHATITLPNTLVEIGYYAFANSLITSVVIPENVKVVGERAFYGSKNLVDIEIASTGTQFNDWQFYDCSKLTNVYFDGSMDDWTTFIFKDEYSSPMCHATNFYILDSNGEVSYNGKNYSVLEDIKLTNNVESLGDWVFFGFKVYNIEIPETITSIELKAFYNCSTLINVYYDGTINDWVNIDFAEDKSNPMYYATNFYILDNSGTISFNDKNYSKVIDVNVTSEITKLSDYAFSGFTDMATIILPNTLEEIGAYAFNNCYSLKNISIPTNVTTIGSHAFFGCIGLESITLSNNITTIGSYAFSDCKGLIDVTLPNSLTIIEEYAFNNCYNLKNITIPSSITKINEKAFYNCYVLKNVYYDGTLANWCNVVIYNTNSTPMAYASNFYLLDSEGTTLHDEKKYELLTDLTTPDEITTIKAYSFSGFKCINYLTISNSVTTINSYAFYNCEHLWIARLGTGLTTIGGYAFTNCYRLTEVRNYSNVSLPNIGKTQSGSGDIMKYALGYYKNSNGSIFNLDSDGHIIPENGFIFASNVFYNNGNNFGYLIDYIGDDTDLVLPNSCYYGSQEVKTYGIKGYAFYNNTKITSVVIPNSISGYNNNGTFYKQVGDYAFYGCANLTTVTIPSNYSSYGSHIFDGCTRLYEIYNLNTSLELTTGSDSYSYLARYAKVIHTSTDEDSIITIDSNGFMFMRLDENQTDDYYLIGYVGTDIDITLPTSFEFNGNTITDYTIYNNAFRDYRTIRSITVPSNIRTFNASTFSNCSGLLEVELPDTLIGLGSYTFNGCYSLTSVRIPNGVQVIGSNVFYYCLNLSSIIIPKSVTSIGYYSFYFDDKLEKIFYEGTEEEWANITINSNSYLNSKATKYYYSETKPDTAGNYWHYVGDVVTIW